MTRAAAATAAGAADNSHDQNQYLTFMLGKEMLALGILAIKEILEYEPPTEVPLMPDFIRGVFNLRGAVVPVVDLAARLGRTPAAISKKTCVVIVEINAGGESLVIGIVVDAVNEVLGISAEDVEPAPAFGASVATEYIAGLGKINGRFVIILDAQRVLSIEQLGDLAQAAHAA